MRLRAPAFLGCRDQGLSSARSYKAYSGQDGTARGMLSSSLVTDQPGSRDSRSDRTVYRADIDGLRAIAVLSVVFFHVQLPFVTGGFIGVDIFFVISGFLITRIISTEIDNHHFRLLNFYERRIRRIIPALFVMLAATSIVSFMVLVPNYYTEFAESTAAAALSVANVFFYRRSGYFEFGHEVLPLLHTWSLGVEEQFYIIFPGIFILGRKIAKLSWSWIILPLFFCSILLGIVSTYFGLRSLARGVVVESVSNGAFYLPMSRSWEFLIGSALATNLFPEPKYNFPCEIVSWLGFALIMVAAVFFDEQIKYPGFWAIVPTVGTALLIYANAFRDTTIGRALRKSPLVGLGLISYSLYLWHWPIIVFTRLFFGDELSLLWYLYVSAAIIFVSWLSWKYVELPLRSNKHTFTRIRLFVGTGLMTIGFVACALIASRTGGLPMRFTPMALAIADGAGTFPLRDCDSKSASEVRRGDVCTIGAPGSPITFALIGDSFANALSPAVETTAMRLGRRGLALTRGGCYPLLGIVTGTDVGCKDFLAAAVQKIRETPSIEKIILVARWTAAVEGSRFGAIKLNRLFITDSTSTGQSYSENRSVFRRGLGRTMESLVGHDVIVLAFIPEQDANVPQAAVLRILMGQREDYSTPRSIVDNRQKNTRKILSEMSAQYGFTLLDAMQALCDSQTCHGVEDDVSLYSDDNHLSRAGALKVAPIILKSFRSTP